MSNSVVFSRLAKLRVGRQDLTPERLYHSAEPCTPAATPGPHRAPARDSPQTTVRVYGLPSLGHLLRMESCTGGLLCLASSIW